MAIKNGQSIETDNCITTITYIRSFTVAIFMYQAQLINTEILSDKIKQSRNTTQCMLDTTMHTHTHTHTHTHN